MYGGSQRERSHVGGLASCEKVLLELSESSISKTAVCPVRSQHCAGANCRACIHVCDLWSTDQPIYPSAVGHSHTRPPE